jgi:hypothetical protein
MFGTTINQPLYPTPELLAISRMERDYTQGRLMHAIPFYPAQTNEIGVYSPQPSNSFANNFGNTSYPGYSGFYQTHTPPFLPINHTLPLQTPTYSCNCVICGRNHDKNEHYCFNCNTRGSHDAPQCPHPHQNPHPSYVQSSYSPVQPVSYSQQLPSSYLQQQQQPQQQQRFAPLCTSCQSPTHRTSSCPQNW